MVGAVLVLIFMLIYYRTLGLAADAALVVCMLLVSRALSAFEPPSPCPASRASS